MKDEIEGFARITGSTSSRRSSRWSMPMISTRSRPTAGSRRGTRTGRSACSTRSFKKGYEYGLSKIYEMVINNDPCYAYLMRCNHTVDQKLVMAHVYGHCDFFKNNAYFGHTTRKMMDEIANHARGSAVTSSASARTRWRRSWTSACRLTTSSTSIPSPSAPRRPVEVRFRAARSRRRRGREPDATVPSKGVHGRLHQPRDALKAEDDERRRPGAARSAFPPEHREGRAALPDRACAAQELATRRPLDRPRRGLYFYPRPRRRS